MSGSWRNKRVSWGESWNAKIVNKLYFNWQDDASSIQIVLESFLFAGISWNQTIFLVFQLLCWINVKCHDRVKYFILGENYGLIPRQLFSPSTMWRIAAMMIAMMMMMMVMMMMVINWWQLCSVQMIKVTNYFVVKTEGSNAGQLESFLHENCSNTNKKNLDDRWPMTTSPPQP